MAHVSIDVATSADSYRVVLGRGALEDLGRITADVLDPQRVVIVTDETVGGLYAAQTGEALRAEGIDVREIRIPPGERSKSWEQAGRVLELVAEARLDRNDAIVALGGGVVGDLAGFCASAYMRGVRFVQVPTTLLAQVDSSVGGKTAVDLSAGKNLAGAFHPPAAVVADLATLDSLDTAAWADGMAEIVKTGFLAGGPLLEMLENEIDRLRRRDAVVVGGTVEACIRFKAGVVESDEREGGAREQLNLGHTLAHARELLEAYGGVSHGVAVAEGLSFAAFLAARLGHCDAEWEARQSALLEASGIPRPTVAHGASDLVAAMHADKKARGGTVRYVLSTGPGTYEVVAVDDETLAEALRMWESSFERI